MDLDVDRGWGEKVSGAVRQVGRAAARVLQCDALGILKSGEKFDLIFLDPPYGSGLEAKAIETVKEFDILSRGGIMVVETRPETALPVLPPEYGTTKTYRYGKIKLTVITRGNN